MANPNVRGEPAPLGPRRRQVGVEEGEQLRARDLADLSGEAPRPLVVVPPLHDLRPEAAHLSTWRVHVQVWT